MRGRVRTFGQKSRGALRRESWRQVMMAERTQQTAVALLLSAPVEAAPEPIKRRWTEPATLTGCATIWILGLCFFLSQHDPREWAGIIFMYVMAVGLFWALPVMAEREALRGQEPEAEFEQEPEIEPFYPPRPLFAAEYRLVCCGGIYYKGATHCKCCGKEFAA